jgi:hypothetical protein
MLWTGHSDLTVVPEITVWMIAQITTVVSEEDVVNVRDLMTPGACHRSPAKFFASWGYRPGSNDQCQVIKWPSHKPPRTARTS